MAFWFLNKKKKALAKKEKIPVQPGHVSEIEPGIHGAFSRLNSFFNVKEYPFDLTYLDILEMLSMFNPDVSQALSIITTLGNSGHEIEINGGRTEAAIERINWMAQHVYSGGADGLINHLLRQVALMGALSGEWVVADRVTDGLVRVVTPPVRTIRFQLVDGVWTPFQDTGKGFKENYVSLNPLTYSYTALKTLDNNPYGIPLMLAALKNLDVQLDAVRNFAAITRKVGMLGITTVKLDQPYQLPGENADLYQERLIKHLQKYAAAYAQSLSEGVAVHYDDQEINHYSISQTAAAAAKIVFQINEEQIMSAFDIPPSMMGRSYSTTETYASVDYDRLIGRLRNFRRIVKRFIEKGYKLDLNLVGIPVDSVSLVFDECTGFKDKEKAETESIRISNVIKKRDAGLITDDEAAQELGYTKATGAKSLAKRFVYDGFGNKYVFKHEQLSISGVGFESAYLNELRQLLVVAEIEAVHAARKAAKKIGKQNGAEEYFAKDVFDAFAKALKKNLGGVDTVVIKHVNEMFGYYRNDVLNTFEKKNGQTRTGYGRTRTRTRFDIDIGLTDKNAIRYLTAIDHYYFGAGNYIADNESIAGKQLINWLETEYLEKGYSLVDDATIDEFENKFASIVDNVSWRKINQIVNTTVGRIQNFGQTLKLYEAGFAKYRIVGPEHGPICDYCKAMVGRVFEVEVAAKRLAKIVDKGFESVDQLPAFLTSKYSVEDVEKMSDQALQDAGFESPPYHPECRHRKAAEI